MPASDRLRRQQILREAEGYLDLISVFGERWSPPVSIRRKLAQHTIDALDRLPSPFADGAQAQHLRGMALRAAERYDEAIEPLRQAADAEPNNLDNWLALGWCYKRTGHLGLAIEALDQALIIDPQQAILYYNLACYWSLAGNTNQALHYLAQAFAMESQYRTLAETEPDFDPIRSDPGFRDLTSMIA